MNNPTLRQTAVLLIQNLRSRTVCSVLLRHEGLRVLEASTIEDLLVLASERPIDVVLADLQPVERAAFHREMMTRLPGVACLFVHERMVPEAMAKEVRLQIRSGDRDDAVTN